jgi:hypothetical protein
MPNADLTVRDTALPQFKVTTSVPYDEVKEKPSLKRLLPLTRLPTTQIAA